MAFLKKRSVQVAGGIVLVLVLVAVLAYAFFFGETYASLKDKDMMTPPFPGTWFGMTKAEFCNTLQIEESDLQPAEPFDSADYWDLEEFAQEYGVSQDELRIYDHYTNQYYMAYTQPIYGRSDYSMDGQSGFVRVIFTDETTWQGETVPPMLCAVFAQFPYILEENQVLYEGIWLDRYGEAFENGKEDIPEGKRTSLNSTTVHRQAQLLSMMYTSGMSPQEIEALDVPHMSEDEINDWFTKIYAGHYEAILPNELRVKDDIVKDHIGTSVGQYIVADVGYMAYYDYFVDALT